MSNTAGWLTVANPLHRAATAEEALRQARAGAIALIIMAVSGLLNTAWSYLHRDELVGLMSRAMQDQPAEQAAMMQGMVPVMANLTIFLGLIFAAVYLVLAIVQWRKPNPWIPIIMLVLAAWGVLTMISNLVMPNPNIPDPAEMEGIAPQWKTVLGYVEMAVTTILLIASWRGANALKTRFRLVTDDALS